MRVASLLPSATETVCALGARADLVGISHECDWPPGLDGIPVVTRTRVPHLDKSGDIDAAVRDARLSALSLYEVDVAALRRADPDVIVTQDLCEVCAVSLDDVCTAVSELARRDVDVVSLRATTLDGIFADVARVAKALDRAELGEALVASLRERVDSIVRRAAALCARPSVLTIEWIDPVMIGGLWMPELVTLAGGQPLVTRPGEPAPTLDLRALTELDPDVLVVKPCGFPVARTLVELPRLEQVLPWGRWRAVRDGRVFVADGSAFFNRPGPRIVDSLEILATVLHASQFADFAAVYHSAFVRIGADLRIQSATELRS